MTSLDKIFPALDKQKRMLKELKCKKRELDIKEKMGMPMTDDEYLKHSRIDADIQQIEFFIEWMEDTGKDDWVE